MSMPVRLFDYVCVVRNPCRGNNCYLNCSNRLSNCLRNVFLLLRVKVPTNFERLQGGLVDVVVHAASPFLAVSDRRLYPTKERFKHWLNIDAVIVSKRVFV